MLHSQQFGRYYNNFMVGDIFVHALTKTITEGDNNLFCLLTMNHHPVHLNAVYAKMSQHGRILVAGPYVLSLVVGISVSDISGKAIANLGFDKVQHINPVFVGDTLHARTVILGKRLSKSKPDRGIITVRTVGYNQEDKDVIGFLRSFMVPVEEKII